MTFCPEAPRPKVALQGGILGNKYSVSYAPLGLSLARPNQKAEGVGPCARLRAARLLWQERVRGTVDLRGKRRGPASPPWRPASAQTFQDWELVTPRSSGSHCGAAPSREILPLSKPRSSLGILPT